MKRWWLIVVLLLSLGVNLGLLASRAWQRSPGAGPAPAPGGPPPAAAEGPPRFALRMAGELDLRGEEREAFLERQRLFLEETLDARDRFGRLQAELRQTVIAEDPDREAVDELLVQISEAHVDLERAFVDNLLDTRELLGREQGRRFMGLLQHLRGSRERDRLRGDRPSWRERRGAGRDRTDPARRPWRSRPPEEPPAEEPPPEEPPPEGPPPPNPETDPSLGQK